MFSPASCSPQAYTFPAVRFGFVTARFHYPIVSAMADAARAVLLDSAVSLKDILVVDVPGSLELSLACHCLLPHCQALIAFGCVVQGGTIHYDLVSYQSTREIIAMSATGIAIVPSIMMTHSLSAAEARATDYGRSAASALLALLVAQGRGDKRVR